jgi:cell division protein YceG involved in septum cleavage
MSMLMLSAVYFFTHKMLTEGLKEATPSNKDEYTVAPNWPEFQMSKRLSKESTRTEDTRIWKLTAKYPNSKQKLQEFSGKIF